MKRLISIFTVLLLVGCSTIQQAYENFNSRSDTTKGAIIGGSAGALVGAALGSQTGTPVEGMIVGSAIGAGIGSTIGYALDTKAQKVEQTEYQKQVKEYELLREREILEGLEHSPRRERVAVGDLYFSKINRQSYFTDSYALQSDKSMASISKVNEVKPVSAEKPDLTPLEPKRAEMVKNNQSILSINPYSSDQKPDQSLSLSKTGLKNEERTSKQSISQPYERSMADQKSNTIEQRSKVEKSNEARRVEEPKPEVKTQNFTQAPDMASIPSSAQELCPEGIEELKKANEATELSSKLFHTRRSIRLCNNFTPGRLALAKLYIELKRYEDASFELENILKTEPNNKEAKELLNSISSR